MVTEPDSRQERDRRAGGSAPGAPLRRTTWHLPRFVATGLRNRAVRASVVAITVLIAATSFLLVTATGKTTNVTIEGRVESVFRPAYDILVRPRGSFTQLERREALVRANYLSGIFGGITLRQYQTIRRLRDVAVAAPIANIGYVLPLQQHAVALDAVVTEEPVQLYRVRVTSVADGGASRYRGDDLYVYYTTRNEFTYGREGISELVPGQGPLPVCSGFDRGRPADRGPFAPFSYLTCFSKRSPGQGSDLEGVRFPRGKVTTSYALYFPVFVAAIDPAQEQRLVGLDDAQFEGRYLRQGERWRLRGDRRTVRYRAIPVLASTETFVAERLEARIERLRVPAGIDVPVRLSSPKAYEFLTGLAGRPVGRHETSPSAFYERLLAQDRIESFNSWTTSETRYRGGVDGPLVPLSVTNPLSVWRSPFQSARGGFWPAPPANRDVQFRRLTPFIGSNIIGPGNVIRKPALEVVGRYDPHQLDDFDALSQVPLETYYAPSLTAADEASRAALGGRPLQPSSNLGNYIQQPPLFLTTLTAMAPLLNPVFFGGAGGRGKAPISVIRVRVDGVRGPDEASLARIRAVALAIRHETGLDVDITAGSSPRRLQVALPAGKFGRPRLLLNEGWVKKGVSVAFLRAVDRKSIALSALILLACSFFVANTVFAGVRTRRAEIGTLLCIGWPRSAIFASVLGEVVLLGLLAGVLGTIVAGALATIFSLSLPLWQTLLVLPIGSAIALVAGLPAAWLAARLAPLEAIRARVSQPVRGARVRGLAALALANLRRVPVRTATGALVLTLGVAALTLLIGITRAFEGTFVGTLLGDAILIDIRGADFASIGIVIGLAGLSLADVLVLNLRERAPELVALRTFGWSDWHLAWVIALEAAVVGLLAGMAGGLAGVAIGATLLDFPLGSLCVGAAIAAAGALIVALVASLVPLAHLTRLTPAVAFADE